MDHQVYLRTGGRTTVWTWTWRVFTTCFNPRRNDFRERGKIAVRSPRCDFRGATRENANTV